MDPALKVRDDANAECYEGVVDNKVVGMVVYRRRGGRVVIRHTLVEPEFRGAGLGTKMVCAVLNDVRERGEKLTNYCGFVADFLAANGEYRDLIDNSQPGVTLPRDKRGEDSDARAIYR